MTSLGRRGGGAGGTEPDFKRLPTQWPCQLLVPIWYPQDPLKYKGLPNHKSCALALWLKAISLRSPRGARITPRSPDARGHSVPAAPSGRPSSFLGVAFPSDHCGVQSGPVSLGIPLAVLLARRHPHHLGEGVSLSLNQTQTPNRSCPTPELQGSMA